MFLSKEFGKLVIIAVVLATPIAWKFMDNWLSEFAYRIELSVWIFLVAGALAFSVAWLTMSYQCLKAAMANPVDSINRP
jgi:putative ABC transport system permease protein